MEISYDGDVMYIGDRLIANAASFDQYYMDKNDIKIDIVKFIIHHVNFQYSPRTFHEETWGEFIRGVWNVEPYEGYRNILTANFDSLKPIMKVLYITYHGNPVDFIISHADQLQFLGSAVYDLVDNVGVVELMETGLFPFSLRYNIKRVAESPEIFAAYGGKITHELLECLKDRGIERIGQHIVSALSYQQKIKLCVYYAGGNFYENFTRLHNCLDVPYRIHTNSISDDIIYDLAIRLGYSSKRLTRNRYCGEYEYSYSERADDLRKFDQGRVGIGVDQSMYHNAERYGLPAVLRLPRVL
jgi:hypothetical protein